MGFLEKLGRRHFPPTSELEKVSSRRLKIWVWFFPCAAAFPSVIILLYGQVVEGTGECRRLPTSKWELLSAEKI
jgi:hypothetical protein